MRAFSTTPIFDQQLKKADAFIKRQIIKKMQKLVLKPELGKPLHVPLQNHFAERVGKHRIIYRFDQKNVVFIFLDHRKKVYRR